MSMTNEVLNSILLEWKNAKGVLDAAKDKEMSLRKVIVEESGLFDANSGQGTENYELGNGWKLKAVKKLNYSVDNTDNKAYGILAAISELDPVSAHLAQKVLSFTPSLRLTEYRELGPQAKALLDTIITTKPASPTLELIPPKNGN